MARRRLALLIAQACTLSPCAVCWRVLVNMRSSLLAQARGEDPKRLIRQMVNRLNDKYSRIVTASAFLTLSRFDPVGVGVLVSSSGPQEYLTISSPPMSGSSAERAGLKKGTRSYQATNRRISSFVGDAVIEINGQTTMGMSAVDVMRMFSADDTPQLKFTVLTEGGVTRDVTLAREQMKFPNPVQYFAQEVVSARPNRCVNCYGIYTHTCNAHCSYSMQHKVGYVRIREWTQDTNRGVRQAVQALNQQGVDVYVVDLRGNPGGGFQFALDVAGVFMKVCTLLATSESECRWSRTNLWLQ
jgi:carboxyl-terminal processing protease